MNKQTLIANIKTPNIEAYTFPAGPKGVGIEKIGLDKNKLAIDLTDGRQQIVELPDWWFGTRAEYNALTKAEKDRYVLHFIEEGS